MPPLLRGLTASISIAAGYLPIAFSFGLAAHQAGLDAHVILMSSVIIYAGASQFVLIALLAPGANLLAAIPTVLLMNARHLFYGPALLGRFTDPTHRLASPLLAFGLTDEVFAAAMNKLESIAPPEKERWYLGLQIGAYAAWILGTLLAIVLGGEFRDPPVFLGEALSFILPGLFFALLLDLNLSRWARIVVLTAVIGIILLQLLPVHHTLALAMVGGAAFNLPERRP